MSRKGNKANEDYAFSCNQYVFVVDSASGLSDKKYSDYESDAQWFAHKLGAHLQRRLHDTNRTIKDIVFEIIRELRVKYDSFLPDVKYDTLAIPSASLSVLRLKGDKIEFFQLGDCVTIILTNDDELKRFRDDTLPKLDNEVVKNVINISREKNIPYSDALIYDKDQLVYNRKKLNKPDGYWTLDLCEIGIEHAYTNTFSACNVKAASIMSDGFAEIVDLYGIYDYKELIKKMEYDSLSSLVDELFRVQNADSSMNKYPRLKPCDDSSAVWCSVQL